MELRDSRRLTGPNFLWERAGAVLDLLLEEGECEPASKSRGALVDAWSKAARRMLDALGWTAERTATKDVGFAPETGGLFQGLCLAISAPLDGLYAACSVNEWALDAATAGLAGASEAEREADFEAARERLAAEIAAEANPALIALGAAARARGVAFLTDDELVSCGMGRGSASWPVGALPAPEAVDWTRIFDLPHAVVTGTNGKSTTVRLLAAMASAAGEVPGISSTDFVRVGDDVLEEGDWSGPGGGRLLLRDPRVTVGLLETARGGMMRRGLALEHTRIAVVLNIGADHLNEWGTPDLPSLTESKLIPVRVADVAVLNADDPELTRAAGRGSAGMAERVWFSLEATNPLLVEHLASGGRATWLADETLWASAATGGATRVADVSDVPMTLGGAARYNIANALAAVATALELGLPLDAIRTGLAAFASGPDDNPGRLNRFDLGGVTVLVDFAHNPDGFTALFAAAAALPATRRLALVGQSGDRDLVSTRGMAEALVASGIDHIVIKELTEHLRGRELGEMPALFEAELRRLGLDESRFSHASSEMAAVHLALEWARPGDLLLLLAHDARAEVLALVQALAARGWVPGEAVVR